MNADLKSHSPTSLGTPMSDRSIRSGYSAFITAQIALKKVLKALPPMTVASKPAGGHDYFLVTWDGESELYYAAAQCTEAGFDVVSMGPAMEPPLLGDDEYQELADQLNTWLAQGNYEDPKKTRLASPGEQQAIAEEQTRMENMGWKLLSEHHTKVAALLADAPPLSVARAFDGSYDAFLIGEGTERVLCIAPGDPTASGDHAFDVENVMFASDVETGGLGNSDFLEIAKAARKWEGAITPASEAEARCIALETEALANQGPRP